VSSNRSSPYEQENVTVLATTLLSAPAAVHRLLCRLLISDPHWLLHLSPGFHHSVITPTAYWWHFHAGRSLLLTLHTIVILWYKTASALVESITLFVIIDSFCYSLCFLKHSAVGYCYLCEHILNYWEKSFINSVFIQPGFGKLRVIFSVHNRIYKFH